MHECYDVLLAHIALVPSAVLTAELAGFGRATIREQLSHVMINEFAWIQVLQGLPILDAVPDDLTTITDLLNAKQKAFEGTSAYVDSMTDQAFNSDLERYSDEWIGPRRTPAYILQHVVTHAFHHKGQIVAMLRMLGHPAPDTDMQRG